MKDLDLWNARKWKDLWNLDLSMDFPKMRLSNIRTPLVNVKDKGKVLEVTAELPGVEKKDIKINVFEDSVSIGAEQNIGKEQKEKSYYYKERSFQSFFRQVPLPSTVKPETAKAEYKNGILKIDLQKKSISKPKDKSFKPIVK